MKPEDIDAQKLRGLIAPVPMIKAPVSSTSNLFKFLLPIASQLPSKLRQEVINAIANSAEARYYDAMFKSETVLDVLATWLKDLTGKEAEEWKGTGLRLIEIIQKLPVTSENLVKLSKIPRYVKKVSEKAPSESTFKLKASLSLVSKRIYP